MKTSGEHLKKDTIKHTRAETALPVRYAVGRSPRKMPGRITAITARTVFAAFTSISNPGDRESGCGGIMEPIAVWVRKNGEWAVIHRCRRCGALSSNRIAADDNPMKLMSVAMKPIGSPPFPLERIEEMTELMAGDGRLK